MEIPTVIVLAGPNGAGKTTASRIILPRLVQITEFVNADVIAQGLSGFAAENVAIEAGRIMLNRLHDLAAQRANFAFETTLASRTLFRHLYEWTEAGYDFHLFYFWVPSPEFSIARVASRVKMGGHFVDSETIRRRYDRSLDNFFHLYQSIADRWFFYNNTNAPGETLIAAGHGTIIDEVHDAALWNSIRKGHDPSYQPD
jgi:predicted ABC-type ATPase